MKKSFLFIIILFASSNLFAQLEVKDTLLMALKNEVFWSTSSELDQGVYKDMGKYGATNLSDNDPSTCWAEGSNGDGTGEYILFTIPENTASIKIKNGYQKNETIYYSNNRPKKIELTLYASYQPAGYITESHTGFFISEPLATTQTILEDKLGFQEIKTGFNWGNINEELSHDNTFDKGRFILKIKIIEVYKGSKWNDACISDIKAVPNPYFDVAPDEHGLLRIYENKTDTLFYNKDSIYQVVELSLDSKWIIFILMPSDIGNSRVETIYKLYNTSKEQFVEIKDVFQMDGFTKKSGKLYLEGSDNDFNDFSICLDEL